MNGHGSLLETLKQFHALRREVSAGVKTGAFIICYGIEKLYVAEGPLKCKFSRRDNQIIVCGLGVAAYE